jgi:glycosyltransferase involved in cell wall biosynthesis
MKRRRLVVLTQGYPLEVSHGDGSFIRQEIAVLAERFDETLVFTYTTQQASGIEALPESVEFGGTLAPTLTRWRLLGHLLRPTTFARTLRAVVAEVWHRRTHVKWPALYHSILFGISLSQSPTLRSALDDDEVETTVYSFWGLGPALCIPWLPSRIHRVVVRLCGYDLYEERSGYIPLRPVVLGDADAVLSVSQHGRDYLVDRYPWLRADRVHASRLGTTDAGLPVDRDRGTGFVIVSCSAVIPLKRVERILDALPLVTSRPLTWVHLGGGEGLQNLRDRVAAASTDATIDLRGFVSHSDVVEFYQQNQVDLFLNVSTTEGIPVSVMEAMSFGIPIVATDVGGTSEIVGADKGSGVLIAPDFRDTDLAAAIDSVLQHRESYDPRRAWELLSDADQNARLAAQLIDATV